VAEAPRTLYGRAPALHMVRPSKANKLFPGKGRSWSASEIPPAKHCTRMRLQLAAVSRVQSMHVPVSGKTFPLPWTGRTAPRSTGVPPAQRARRLFHPWSAGRQSNSSNARRLRPHRGALPHVRWLQTLLPEAGVAAGVATATVLTFGARIRLESLAGHSGAPALLSAAASGTMHTASRAAACRRPCVSLC